MRELKELTALEQELLDTQVAESKEIDRLRSERLKVKRAAGGSARVPSEKASVERTGYGAGNFCLPCEIGGPEKSS